MSSADTPASPRAPTPDRPHQRLWPVRLAGGGAI